MAKRTSRSHANEIAPGAPAEPRVPTPPKGRSRSRQSTTSSDLPKAPADIVASEIENPVTLSEPSDEEIRLRAYQRFLERGGSHGDDFNDWLEAERELKKL